MLTMLWLTTLHPTAAPVGEIFLFSFSAVFSLGLTATATHYLNLFPANENKLS
jgi:hypothetical protein